MRTHSSSLAWRPHGQRNLVHRVTQSGMTDGAERACVCAHTHTPIFIVALFTIARIWRQLKCPSTEE